MAVWVTEKGQGDIAVKSWHFTTIFRWQGWLQITKVIDLYKLSIFRHTLMSCREMAKSLGQKYCKPELSKIWDFDGLLWSLMACLLGASRLLLR